MVMIFVITRERLCEIGSCFIETKNLDGETNLKQKNVPKGIHHYFKTAEDVIILFDN